MKMSCSLSLRWATTYYDFLGWNSDTHAFNTALHCKPVGIYEADNDITGLMEKPERSLL